MACPLAKLLSWIIALEGSSIFARPYAYSEPCVFFVSHVGTIALKRASSLAEPLQDCN